jgi:His-Xaa-Ser system protein HxsD
MAKSPGEVGDLTVRVDLNLYSRSALQKAVFPFTKTYFVEIRGINDREMDVIFTPKDRLDEWEQLRGNFLNELLDQSLREQIARETEPVRNLILAHALSNIDLIGSETSPLPKEP